MWKLKIWQRYDGSTSIPTLLYYLSSYPHVQIWKFRNRWFGAALGSLSLYSLALPRSITATPRRFAIHLYYLSWNWKPHSHYTQIPICYFVTSLGRYTRKDNFFVWNQVPIGIAGVNGFRSKYELFFFYRLVEIRAAAVTFGNNFHSATRKKKKRRRRR